LFQYSINDEFIIESYRFNVFALIRDFFQVEHLRSVILVFPDLYSFNREKDRWRWEKRRTCSNSFQASVSCLLALFYFLLMLLHLEKRDLCR